MGASYPGPTAPINPASCPVLSFQMARTLEVSDGSVVLGISLEAKADSKSPRNSKSSSYRVTAVAPERVRSSKTVQAAPRKPTVLGIPLPPSSRVRGSW
jgi:hypothetical protein